VTLSAIGPRPSTIYVKTDADLVCGRGTTKRTTAGGSATPGDAGCRSTWFVTIVSRFLPDNRSGDAGTTIRYTVQNPGLASPIWPGTSYWNGLYLDLRGRHFPSATAPPSWIGKSRYGRMPSPLQPGESYTAEVTAALPKGIGGNLFAYIHPRRPTTTNYDERPPGVVADRLVARGRQRHQRRTARHLSAVGSVKTRGTKRLPHPDPCPPITRPDLVISNLQVPDHGDHSGQNIAITYTVTNQGNSRHRVREGLVRFASSSR